MNFTIKQVCVMDIINQVTILQIYFIHLSYKFYNTHEEHFFPRAYFDERAISAHTS